MKGGKEGAPLFALYKGKMLRTTTFLREKEGRKCQSTGQGDISSSAIAYATAPSLMQRKARLPSDSRGGKKEGKKEAILKTAMRLPVSQRKTGDTHKIGQKRKNQ